MESFKPEKNPVENPENEERELLDAIPSADAVAVLTEWFELNKKGEAVPSLESKMRALGALELFESGKAKKIFLIGSGHREGYPTNTSAAAAMKEYLLSRGIPEDAIATEEGSVNTAESLEELLTIIEKEGVLNVLLETNEYHIPRARQLFENILKKHGLQIEFETISAETLLQARSPHYKDLTSHFEFPASLKNAPKEALTKGLREFLRRVLIYIDRNDRLAKFLAAKVRESGE